MSATSASFPPVNPVIATTFAPCFLRTLQPSARLGNYRFLKMQRLCRFSKHGMPSSAAKIPHHIPNHLPTSLTTRYYLLMLLVQIGFAPSIFHLGRLLKSALKCEAFAALPPLPIKINWPSFYMFPNKPQRSRPLFHYPAL